MRQWWKKKTNSPRRLSFLVPILGFWEICLQERLFFWLSFCQDSSDLNALTLESLQGEVTWCCGGVVASYPVNIGVLQLYETGRGWMHIDSQLDPQWYIAIKKASHEFFHRYKCWQAGQKGHIPWPYMLEEVPQPLVFDTVAPCMTKMMYRNATIF